MSKKTYEALAKAYKRKDRLYPDNGRSVRPWEQPLRNAIQAEIEKGRQNGEKWAAEAHDNWNVEGHDW